MKASINGVFIFAGVVAIIVAVRVKKAVVLLPLLLALSASSVATAESIFDQWWKGLGAATVIGDDYKWLATKTADASSWE